MTSEGLEPLPGTAQTVMTDLASYEIWLRSGGASQNTVTARLRFLRARIADWGALEDVTPQQVREFLANQNLARWSRVTYYNHLKSAYDWLLETNAIEVSPMAVVRRARVPKGTPRPLSRDETERVLHTAEGIVREWVLLAMFAGLRAHEIAKIRTEDVDRDNIFVCGKGEVEATIPTHPLIWEIARTKPRSGYWYPSYCNPGPIQPATVTSGVSTLFSSLGIEGSVHRGRHSFGTQLVRSGVNLRVVQTLMRHSSLETTANYCAVDEDERAAAVNLLAAIT